jgi:hypothetical protein
MSCKKNLIKFIDVKVYLLKSTSLSFLGSQKTKYLNMIFLYICGTNSLLHPNIFPFLKKLTNMSFIF